MLMIKSTPRMTYRMGMRAWLDAPEDKFFPFTYLADADGEVAADFNVSSEF